MFSSVKPIFSLTAAYSYFMNITPVKKFIRKKFPISMNNIKKRPFSLWYSTIGPLSMSLISITLYITSGQDSDDASPKRQSIPCPISSKFEDQGYQV
jgi:hypothetical protein